MADTSSAVRLRRIITGRCPCITITTYEEAYALDVVREALDDKAIRLDVATWSLIGGLRPGINSKGGEDPDTENPAAALYTLLKKQSGRTVAVLR